MAYPDVLVELGLGGRFRQRLINEAFVAGCWPLAEVVSMRARDITINQYHGTYDEGIDRGVTVPLPEGALGATFDGTVQVTVPNADGLSLENGSMDIVFLCKTTTNDSVLRGIVVKHDGTNGYYVALRQGGITFNLAVGGITIVAMSRGAGLLNDDEWHLVHVCYQPEQNLARVFFDGVQVGTDGSGTTEPQIVDTPLRIGGLIPSEGRYIGSLAYVMVGREGNITLSGDLQPTRAWTDVTDDVEITEPLRLMAGIQGTGELDRTAGPGPCTLLLDNSHRNSAATLGYYSIGHPNCRAGFTLNTPLRVSVLDPDSPSEYHIEFLGAITKADAQAGEIRERRVSVEAKDWFRIPAQQPLSAIAAQVDVPSHLIFWTLVDQCDQAPHAVDVIPGGESLAYALDSGSNQMRILQEMARIAESGQDYAYLQGDGTLVYEPRYLRRNETTADAQYDNTMLDVMAPTDQAAIVNIVRGEIVPRDLDDASGASVLFSQTNRQPIDPGGTLVIEGLYKDPDQPKDRIGGIEVIDPVATTDYTMTTSLGADITGNAVLIFEAGGAGFRATIRNTHATEVGYFMFSQIRGLAIRRNESILVEERDLPSIREHGPRDLTLSMPYQTSVLLARDVAQQILERRKDAKALPATLVLGGDTQIRDVLERDIGDKVEIIEEVTGIDDALIGSPATPTGYYIQSKELVIEAGPVLTATFGLTQAPSILGQLLWIVGIPGFAELAQTTFVAPL